VPLAGVQCRAMRPTDRQRSQTRPWIGARRRPRLALAAFGGAALVAGCVAGVQPPPGVRPPAPPPAGYERMVDSLGPLDRAPLAGKKIVLDPGHGGFFKGALGVHGLTEADVNLGVALDLAAILRAHGAEVLLTRETDRDFLSPADSSLRSDLNTRVKMNNDFRPDLFLSIHHNADPRGAHDVNETQVYYQLGDDGAALDAAADLDRFLTRNLGIGASRLLSGNYAVLRGSEAPAILTESSYITYPPTEARLATESARKIEAQSLALGIAAFFARKAPRIESFTAGAASQGSATVGAETTSTSGFVAMRATVHGASDQIAMTLDGMPVVPTRTDTASTTFLEWRPSTPLEAGWHQATLLARLAGEGSSARARVEFEIRPRPDSIAVEFPEYARAEQLAHDVPAFGRLLPRRGRAGSARAPDSRRSTPIVAARIRVLGAGVAIADSATLRVTLSGGFAPADTAITLRDGVAWAYFRPARHSWTSPRSIALRATLVGTGVRTTARIPWRPAEWSNASFFLTRMPENVPLRDAPGTREPHPVVGWVNRDGFVCSPPAAISDGPLPQEVRVGIPDVPLLAGYRHWEDRSQGAYSPFVAIASGALHERRIVIDPAGGGDDPAGVSASGTRGAQLNLDVARMLQSMLEAAGAEVLLTRTSDVPASDFERVKISEGFHADRFVRIGHLPAPARLGHYFSSAVGTRWANDLADLAPRFGLPRPSVGDDAQYPIQQSSASALYVQLGRVDSTGAADGAPDPARLRAEAYAIYLSLARQWAPPGDWPLDSLTVRDPDGRPIPRTAVRLGTLVLETDSLGVVRFARTEPGPMLVTVDGMPEASRVLLDSERGVVLTGRPAP